MVNAFVEFVPHFRPEVVVVAAGGQVKDGFPLYSPSASHSVHWLYLIMLHSEAPISFALNPLRPGRIKLW